MRRLHLPFAEPAGALPEGAEGSVIAVTSPMGFDCALLSGGAQSIAGRTPSAEPGLWLGLLLDGEAALRSGGPSTRLSPDAFILGATGVDACLHFFGPFRYFFLRVPAVALGSRLLAPIDARVAPIEPRTLAERALLALLRTLADGVHGARPEDLRPMESALVELLVPAVAGRGGEGGRGGSATARARQLDRVCRAVETRLGDPELTVRGIAQGEGVSVRYLQQLFAGAGLTVSGYVRARRLERARAELESPLHARISISEIGFRWGFNQSAHFSRAYRERYGEAPRETRSRSRGDDARGGTP